MKVFELGRQTGNSPVQSHSAYIDFGIFGLAA